MEQNHPTIFQVFGVCKKVGCYFLKPLNFNQTMKILIVFSMMLFLCPLVKAQCDFDPTVEGELILCPFNSTTLSTQEYDSYQWYKREYGSSTPVPIDGATGQTIMVSNPDDVLYSFSVEATLDNCTETSPEVLVDGWAFLPVTVASTGDFTVGNNGESIVCIGDTMYFTLNLPYNTNITWYKNGTPIPGETSTVLTVTSEGNYTVSGAPDICPDFVQFIGVTLVVEFTDCTLAVDPEPGADEPVLIYPNPATDRITLESESTQLREISIYNSLGQLAHREITSGHKVTIDVSGFAKGIYFVAISHENGTSLRKLIVE